MKQVNQHVANCVAGGGDATPDMEADKTNMEGAVRQMAADLAVRNAVAENQGAFVDSGGRE